MIRIFRQHLIIIAVLLHGINIVGAQESPQSSNLHQATHQDPVAHALSIFDLVKRIQYINPAIANQQTEISHLHGGYLCSSKKRHPFYEQKQENQYTQALEQTIDSLNQLKVLRIKTQREIDIHIKHPLEQAIANAAKLVAEAQRLRNDVEKAYNAQNIMHHPAVRDHYFKERRNRALEPYQTFYNECSQWRSDLIQRKHNLLQQLGQAAPSAE